MVRRRSPGFPRTSPGLEPITGVALGSATVSPINMANAYATLAGDGQAAEPYIIEKVELASGETDAARAADTAAALAGLAAEMVTLFSRNLFRVFPLRKLYLEIPGFNWDQLSSGETA